jgi:hypothetical protein
MVTLVTPYRLALSHKPIRHPGIQACISTPTSPEDLGLASFLSMFKRLESITLLFVPSLLDHCFISV